MLLKSSGVSRGGFWLPGNPPPTVIFFKSGGDTLLTPSVTSHLNFRLLETPLRPTLDTPLKRNDQTRHASKLKTFIGLRYITLIVFVLFVGPIPYRYYIHNNNGWGTSAGFFFITFPILCYFWVGLGWVLGLLHLNIFLGTHLFNVEAASLVSTV